MNQLTLVKTVASTRRGLKNRRMWFTCQARVRTTSTASQVVSRSGGEKKEPLDSVAIPTSTKTAEVSLSLSADENDTVSGSLSYGTVSVIGRRKEMEDAVRVKLGFFDGKDSSSGKESLTSREGSRYDFFGVYDGHGGAWVAEACRQRMHEVIAEEMAIMSSSSRLGVKDGGKECYWERVMEGGFKRMDEEVAKDRMVGSTAVVAVVGPDVVVVANCGDSRAVLFRAGVAFPLSVDHKPDRPDESERIEAAGGKVINWNGHRILGVLATSRSIGDEYLKPYVISKPEVTVTKRSELDEFLILASDGLWDVVSNEIACQIGRKCLSGRMRRKSQDRLVVDNKAAEAAAILTELAMARGSKDNISVVVVDLKNNGRFSSK